MFVQEIIFSYIFSVDFILQQYLRCQILQLQQLYLQIFILINNISELNQILSSYQIRNLIALHSHYLIFMIQERPNNIQVLIRAKPCAEQSCVQILDFQSLMCGQTEYVFDRVLSSDVTQEEMFQQVGHHMVTNALDGFNSCILAYGQTGSGKTHTLTGKNDGILPKTLQTLIAKIKDRKKTLIKLSYFEIYNEQIFDLLQNNKALQIKEDIQKAPFIKDLKEVVVENFQQCLDLLNTGNQSRKTGATRMNQCSSRSHAVLYCQYIQLDHANQINVILTSKLYFVDLAGSERQKNTGAVDKQLKEGCSINKSLSALGLCIQSIVKQNQHIPYRDSKLTNILRDCLGGNSKTFMIATIHQDQNYQSQTISTLKFAERAKQVKTRAHTNKTYETGEIQKLNYIIQSLQEELNEKIQIIEELRTQLNERLSQDFEEVRFPSQDPNHKLKQEILLYKEQLKQQEENNHILMEEQKRVMNISISQLQNENQRLNELNESLEQAIKDLNKFIHHTSQNNYQYISQSHRFNMQYNQFQNNQIQRENLGYDQNQSIFQGQQNSASKSRFQQIQSQNIDYKEKSNKLEFQVLQLQNQLDDLYLSINENEQQIQDQNDQIEQYIIQLKDLQIKFNEQIDKYNSLETVLNDQQEKLDFQIYSKEEFQNELQVQQRKNKKLQNIVDRIKEQYCIEIFDDDEEALINKIDGIINYYKNDSKVYKDQFFLYAQELQKQKQYYISLQNQHEQLNQKFQYYQVKLNEAETSQFQLNKDMDNLRQEKKVLENQYKALRDKYRDYYSELQQITDDLKEGLRLFAQYTNKCWKHLQNQVNHGEPIIQIKNCIKLFQYLLNDWTQNR
ncbi:microtubule motor activity protein [Paramecium bursaria]